MECKKCKSNGSILLRKNDSYCYDCFVSSTNHKFRACIGKNKILSKNEKVLVCLSGGPSSTVLLNLIYNGISMESYKKLRILPLFLHIMNGENDHQTGAKNIIKQCEKYNFSVYLIHISQYMKSNIELSPPNEITSVKSTVAEQFNSLLNNMPSTACSDLLTKIKRNLFVRCAEKLECDFIFTAEASTTLAINLLSSITLGRGSQVENDVGFCDTKHSKIKILRPMRDIGEEEINHFIAIKNLNPVKCNDIRANSVQSVIKSFVSDLQENFPATISTVCKTADKISFSGDHDRNREKCVICESDLGKADFKLTAFDATKFSRASSNRIPPKFEASFLGNIGDIEDESINKSLFPFIHKCLCYACSRNYSEMDKHTMPDHVKKLLQNQ